MTGCIEATKMSNHFKNRILIITLITVITLGLLFIPLHTKSETSTNINPVVKVEEPLSNKDLLWKIGKDKGMSQQTLIQIERVIKCESSWDENAVGDHGQSFGLVQIYLPANPEVKKEQALNPEFALNYITSEFAKGHQKKWSCYKLLYLQ